jgi:hypothetical protein
MENCANMTSQDFGAVFLAACLFSVTAQFANAQANPTCSFTNGGHTYNNACVWTKAYDNDRDNVNVVEPFITAGNVHNA